MTGADIKAAALGAAFLARSEGTRIAMTHVTPRGPARAGQKRTVVRAGGRPWRVTGWTCDIDRLTLELAGLSEAEARRLAWLVAEALASRARRARPIAVDRLRVPPAARPGEALDGDGAADRCARCCGALGEAVVVMKGALVELMPAFGSVADART